MSAMSIVPQSERNGNEGQKRGLLGGNIGPRYAQFPPTDDHLASRLPAQRAYRFIRDLCDGRLSEGTPDFKNHGPYRSATEDVFEAYCRAGESGAQLAYEALQRLTPELLPQPDAGSASPSLLWEGQIWSLEDAFSPRPPMQYAIDGLLPMPSLTIVYGARGDLKSMVMLDAALAVASGQSWLDPEPPAGSFGRATLQVPVLWYDFDNGRRRVAERLQALAKGRGLEAEHLSSIPLSYAAMPNPPLDLSDSDSVHRFGELIRHHGIRLLFLDNLGTVTGEVEENTAQMAGVMSHLRTLVEEHTLGCVVIHHARKDNGFQRGPSGESLRGHSSIMASLDLALQVEREKGANKIVFHTTKARGPFVPPFGGDFSYTTRDDGELDTARFYGVDVADANSDGAIERVIVEVLSENGPQKQSQLKDEVMHRLPGVGKNRVIGVAEEMAQKGHLMVERGGRNAKIYSQSASFPVSRTSQEHLGNSHM